MIYRMKKNAFIILSIVGAYAIIGTKPVYASLCPNGSSFTNLCNLQAASAGGYIGTIVEVLLIIAIISSLFFLIYGGIRYISSGGDKGKIDQARSTLIAAIIGLIVSLAAFFILNFILVFFTGQGLMNMQIPTLLQ